MNGELAQIIALITYGNKFLSAAQGDVPELFPSNSTFQYLADLSFIRAAVNAETPPQAEVIATSTLTWFARLKDARVSRLWLAFMDLSQAIPQYMTVAFAGSNNWAIRADSGQAWELWRAKWLVKDLHQPQKKIWSVEYWGWANHPAQVDAPQVDQAAGELMDSLANARAFSDKAGLGFWSRWFEDAIGSCDHPGLELPYHPDLVPEDFLSLRSRQLLACACKSWVFGGMGSWNDVYLEASLQKEYEAVSAGLYQSVLNALCAVANRDPIQDNHE